jgi:predicted pyridoxine 5'-phosphate oxidase superfamily flavin-nucleotide-binding protein
VDAIYHSGEIKVQTKAGAVEAASNMVRQVLPVIAHLYVDFIQSQPFVVIGATDSQCMAWGTILSGKPGFMRVVDERTLRIDAIPDDQDPLSRNFSNGIEVGLLLMDFSTRRRLRLNGRMVVGEHGFSVQTRQVYSNCPRYIQSRLCESDDNAPRSPRKAYEASTLNGELQDLIRRADTFFIASSHPEGGADVSHRGGFPGFVQVQDGETLVWPDYNGNSMFNTLGNIAENPQCGLLFLDFETGTTLQLSGTANIVWDRERAVKFPGAERLIEFRAKRIVETKNATDLRWRFNEYSPDNPWFC